MRISMTMGSAPLYRQAPLVLALSLAACSGPEPVARPASEPRQVPEWYQERPAENPLAKSAEERLLDSWSELPTAEAPEAPPIAQEPLAQAGTADQEAPDPIEPNGPATPPQPGPAQGRKQASTPQAEVIPAQVEAQTEAQPQAEPPLADAHDPAAAQPQDEAPALDQGPGELASAEPMPEPKPLPEPEAFDGLPFEVPPIPAYRKPGLEDCDWLIQGGVARSTRELDDIRAADHEGYLLGPAYRASMTARRDPSRLAQGRTVVIGVYDDAAEGVLGGGWSVHSPRSVFYKNEAGEFEDIAIEIVGLDESCEVSISWDSRWGNPRSIGLYDIGIRGRNDSFLIRANSGVERLIIDGCWWLPCREYAGTNQRHASGMHIDKWGVLIWRNHKWRGETPDSPGINLREHCAYLKSARKGTWIVGNDLRGGNRTGFQIRPEVANNEPPRGPVVIANNYADGYGWNNGSNPASFDGGSCITVWSNPDDSTYIFGNRITDAKYGCLTVTAQTPAKNWQGESGFPIGPVYLANNTFENARGDRDAASITAAEAVHVYGNHIQGRLVLNDTWPMQRHGIPNGEVFLHDPKALELNIWSWDGRDQKIRAVGAARKAKLLSQAGPETTTEK